MRCDQTNKASDKSFLKGGAGGKLFFKKVFPSKFSYLLFFSFFSFPLLPVHKRCFGAGALFDKVFQSDLVILCGPALTEKLLLPT